MDGCRTWAVPQWHLARLQFVSAKAVDGRLLSEAMKGRSYQANLDMAWELYACEELAKQGFTKKFQRAYVELEEFEMLLGSMAVYHFGARYPCFCGREPIPLNWWHVRLHIYIGNRLVPVEDAVSTEDEFLKSVKNKNVVSDPIAKHTVDPFDPPAHWRGLLPVHRFFE